MFTPLQPNTPRPTDEHYGSPSENNLTTPSGQVVTGIKFYITIEERRRAQARAAELDIGKTKPPGQPPYVWDNRMGCVNRWYNYGSAENTIGTVYFSEVVGADGPMVECTTEITYHPLGVERTVGQVRIADLEKHKRLVGFFFQELLGRRPRFAQIVRAQNG